MAGKIPPLLAVAKKYGATIASDGWSNVQCRPILKFMAAIRAAAIFLRSVDCTDQKAVRKMLHQVISASSCERNWSAHGHIHSKIRNRLEPATTEMLVYDYSNSKMMAATRDADELKIFPWDNEDATSRAFCKQLTPGCGSTRAWSGRGKGRVAESTSRRVARFSQVVES